MEKIDLIDMDSCDGQHIGKLKSSSDCDTTYLILEGFSRVVLSEKEKCLLD